MSVNSYPKGSLVQVTGTYKNASNVNTDPTTALFAYADGTGVVHSNITPTHGGTGVFTYIIDTSYPDTKLPIETWWYKFYTVVGDSLQTSNQNSFTVTNPGGF